MQLCPHPLPLEVFAVAALTAGNAPIVHYVLGQLKMSLSGLTCLSSPVELVFLLDGGVHDLLSSTGEQHGVYHSWQICVVCHTGDCGNEHHIMTFCTTPPAHKERCDVMFMLWNMTWGSLAVAPYP